MKMERVVMLAAPRHQSKHLQSVSKWGICVLLFSVGSVLFLKTSRVLSGIQQQRQLQQRPHRVLPVDLEEDEGDGSTPLDTSYLRIASFGGSNCWGAGSGLPERFVAYPYLLDTNIDNYCSLSTTANQAAVCLKSLIGDEKMYDVITLDFTTYYTGGAFDLAERLRQRFPQAMLVFVRHTPPNQWYQRHNETGKHGFGWVNWMIHNNFFTNTQQGVNRDKVRTKMEQGLARDLPWKWTMNDVGRESFYGAVQAVDGIIVDGPPYQAVSGALSLLNGYKYYQDHGTMFSVEGHEKISEQIKLVVSQQVSYNPANAKHGDWENGGDACHFWCVTEHSTSSEIVEYNKARGEFSLEFYREGWFEIEQPFRSERTLYLTYLVTSENDQDSSRIKINSIDPSTGISSGYIENVVLSTATWHATVPEHAARTISVGKLPKGKHIIMATLLDKGLQGVSSTPFRIVGVTFSDEIRIPNEWNFVAQFNNTPIEV